MEKITWILSLIPLVLPFLNVFYMARGLERFYSNKNHMKIFEDYCNTTLKNNLQWQKLTAGEVQEGLKDKHYLRHDSRHRKAFFVSYKKVCHTIVLYCVLTLVSAFIWVIAFTLNITHYKVTHLEITSVLLLYGFGITWVLGVAPLLNFLKLWGWVPEKINSFTYDVIGPYGKLAMSMPKIAVRLAILPINAVIFTSYVKYIGIFLKDHLPIDFFMFIIILGSYQYIVCPVYAFITYHILKKRQEKKGKTALSFEYYSGVIKNNTYFLFLMIYIFVKYIQIFGIEAYGLSMVEAIGILFLFDTYLQQNKTIDAIEKKKVENYLPNDSVNKKYTDYDINDSMENKREDNVAK